MTCEECLHYEVCSLFTKADGANHEYYTYANLSEKCECFKDKSEWVHLPCKVGDTVYRLQYIEPTPGRFIVGVAEIKFSLIWLEEFGNTVFLTREDAEAALKERRADNAKIH